MRNILFIKESKGNYRGGIEGKILSIARQFYERENIRPVLLTTDADSLFAREFKELGLEVYSIRMDRLFKFRKLARLLDPIVEKHNIGIIQSHAFRESMFGRSYRRRNKQIKHIFRVHTHIQGSTINPVKIFMYHQLDRITQGGVDSFVVISELMRSELIDKSCIAPEKISVVYNGVPPLGEPDLLKEDKQGLNPVIAIIGEIEERKQQHIAIEAIQSLKVRGKLIKLILIGRGEGDYFQELKKSISKYQLDEQVQLTGQLQPAKILNTIRDVPVIILPSLFEGVPTSIIEGMSLRKLVITTPVGATTELVKNRENGFLHEPGDVEGLESILDEIFSSYGSIFNAMREAGYDTYLEKFTLASMIDGLAKVYQDLEEE